MGKLTIKPLRIEEISMNAWPAIQQLFYDGWILRFSNGFTKRANSVNVLYKSTGDPDQKIERCASVYKEKKLNVIFRLTPLCQSLDEKLARLKYRKFETTKVMVLDLKNIKQFNSSTKFDFRSQVPSIWIRNYYHIGGFDQINKETHQKIIGLVAQRLLLAELLDKGQIVSMCMAIIEDQYAGIFDLFTAEEHRNKGLAGELLKNILLWTQVNEVRYVYLQVVETNEAAIHTYQKFGFRDFYQYWYRIANH